MDIEKFREIEEKSVESQHKEFYKAIGKLKKDVEALQMSNKKLFKKLGALGNLLIINLHRCLFNTIT